MTPPHTPSRRTLLKGSGASLASIALAGCLSSAMPDDSTGETPTSDSATTVAVGPDGNLVFEPATVYVEPGQTETWTWQSNNHNLQSVAQPEATSWGGTDGPKTKTYDEGHTYEHTFETKGTYEYQCFPHAPDMRGTVVVTDSPPTGTQPQTETETSKSDSEPHEKTGSRTETPTTVDWTNQSEVTIKVGPTGRWTFEPERARISAGTTVNWVWKTDNHNITVVSHPGGSEWEGTEGPKTETYSKGHTYEHTFETTGTYEYQCFPHSPEMKGTLYVE